MSPPASAAAWKSERRWLEAAEVQKLPPSVPSVDTALANPSARRMAVAISRQPATGSQRNVDGTPPIACGLNTSIGPWVDRMPEVRANTSALVVVDTTGPG
jgi:hypothetical protein